MSSAKVAVPAVQAKINALHVAHRDKTIDIERERDIKRNAVYAKRTTYLASKGPKNFWSLVIRAHPDVQEVAGPYDDEILDSITSMDVTFTDEGSKVTITFAKNDLFEDASLWAEENDDGLFFSGVKWKPGRGPLAQEEDDTKDRRQVGSKSSRENDKRGPSLFEFFEELGPHPEDDSEYASADDEELDEAVEEWEEDQDDRKEFFGALVDEIWARPIDVISGKLSGDDLA